MDRLYRNLKIILPILLLLVLASCTRAKEIRAVYSFFFIIIFVLFCVPGAILSGISRTSSSKAPQIIGIILTSMAALFGLLYTFNYFENRYASRDGQITAYLFIMWATIFASAIMLIIPKPKSAIQNPKPVTPRNPQQGKVFQSEEEILRAAELIKQKKAQRDATQNSEYLNKDVPPKADKNDGSVDMSGLNDL